MSSLCRNYDTFWHLFTVQWRYRWEKPRVSGTRSGRIPGHDDYDCKQRGAAVRWLPKLPRFDSLQRLGELGAVHDGALVVEKDALGLNKRALGKLAKTLTSLGLHCSEEDRTLCLQSDAYPEIWDAWTLLATLGAAEADAYDASGARRSATRPISLIGRSPTTCGTSVRSRTASSNARCSTPPMTGRWT